MRAGVPGADALARSSSENERTLMTDNQQSKTAATANGAGRVESPARAAARRPGESEIRLLRATLMCPRDREPTEQEVELFCRQIERTGLDPFARQIYVVYRYNRRRRREEMSIETTIDGLRLIAERTGRYEGQTRVYWCGEDGEWRESWPAAEPPVAATVGVHKRGAREPTWGTAHFREYAEFWEDSGKAKGFYETMPRNQLAIRAEALALRKAFPAELSGLYAAEEMAGAELAHAAAAEVAPPGNEPVAAEEPEPRGLVAAPPRGGPAAPAQLRRELHERIEQAGLSVDAAARLAGFHFEESRLDRLSEAEAAELGELVKAIGSGQIAEGTLTEQLAKAERHPDRAGARALIASWIRARADAAERGAEPAAADRGSTSEGVGA